MSETSSNKPTHPKTVFIVGAGASKEVGLPIGSELKKSIARVLDIRFKFAGGMVSGDDRIAEALRIEAGRSDPPSRDINPLIHAGWRIRDAMPQAISIDDFIDSQSGDKQVELCGKLAIVRTILEAEAESKLFVKFLGNHRLEFDGLEDTWFYRFVQMLITSCSVSNLAIRLKSVAFVIFNYDRCVEHYLYNAIQRYYSVSAEDAANVLKCLEIYHPYGTIGSLSWLSTQNTIEFGATPHARQLLGLASSIKTFSEVTDESSGDVNSIRSIMETSHKLIFLGFAFHRMNIQLLLPKAISGERRIFATGLGMSRSNTDFISADLASRLSISEGDIQIRDITCSRLIQEYWQNLSFVNAA
ncbi:MAG TPA: hypothetical protein VGQ08_15735 [Nitrospiraceae bacterium]|jgi:hypothetical protein|nr:hypothetical protein [Nitrospiraceae bacterium]